MALLRLLTTALMPYLASFSTDVSGPILYLLHRGEAKKAFCSYLDHAQESKQHDFSLLQQAAKTLLEQGIESKDNDIRLLCIFGAGVATSADLLPILAKGIKSNDMKMQLIALSYLAKLQDDEADLILTEALSSPFLLPRLEALFQLAKKNHPSTLAHLHALSVKVPEQIRSLFAQIAIEVEGIEANRFLKNLLFDSCVEVRIETLLTLARGGREDFLPQIRTLAHGASHAQLEGCAAAFGQLRDYLSLNRLRELAQHQEESVRLSAIISLCHLGEVEHLESLMNLAQNGSLFAIYALGQLEKGQDLLFKLTLHKERDIRFNALLALLTLRDQRALGCLEEFLMDEGKDWGFWPIHSSGGTLTAWKVIPSATCQKNYPNLLAQTAALRETMLSQCIEFEERDFLKIAHKIFDKKQHPLVPLLIELLLNMKSEAVISFLKEGYQKTGAPLIRNYSMLALYRINEKGPYEEQLISWVKEKGNVELIRFKEEVKTSLFTAPHELTPEETSRFLVDACEILASTQNEAGIEALIHTIAYGNPKNRYALAGLLIRTTQ